MQFFFLSSQYSSTAGHVAGQCSRLRGVWAPASSFRPEIDAACRAVFGHTNRTQLRKQNRYRPFDEQTKPKTVMLWNTNEWNSWFWPPVGIITHRVKDKHIILVTADEYVVSRMGNKMLKSMYLPISIETCLFWRSRAQTVSCTKRSWKWT